MTTHASPRRFTQKTVAAILASVQLAAQLQSSHADVLLTIRDDGVSYKSIADQLAEQYNYPKSDQLYHAVRYAIQGCYLENVTGSYSHINGLITDPAERALIHKRCLRQRGTSKRDHCIGMFAMSDDARRDHNRNNGYLMLQRKQGIHAQTPEQRKLVVRAAVLACGYRPFKEREHFETHSTLSELELLVRMVETKTYVHKVGRYAGKTNWEDLRKDLGKLCYDDGFCRSKTSLMQAYSHYRNHVNLKLLAQQQPL